MGQTLSESAANELRRMRERITALEKAGMRGGERESGQTFIGEVVANGPNGEPESSLPDVGGVCWVRRCFPGAYVGPRTLRVQQQTNFVQGAGLVPATVAAINIDQDRSDGAEIFIGRFVPLGTIVTVHNVWSGVQLSDPVGAPNTGARPMFYFDYPVRDRAMIVTVETATATGLPGENPFPYAYTVTFGGRTFPMTNVIEYAYNPVWRSVVPLNVGAQVPAWGIWQAGVPGHARFVSHSFGGFGSTTTCEVTP